MKKYMINPITGEQTEIENTDFSWEIVEVHFDGEKKQYRAVKYDSNKVVKFERLYPTKEQAEAYVAEQ
tara:strand:- start:102 stop:305 length:204 start_codon:yes stop_codon:yes gene_type:complete